MSGSRSADEWKEIVQPLLVGINRYNPENIETLEQYVSFQCEGYCYDFEANLALLNLYQFRPTRINKEIAAQILLKALTQLPKTDFIILKCVLCQDLQVDPAIQSIVSLHTLLECCQFKTFWETVEEVTGTVKLVTTFKDTIRKYICSVLSVSYQNIPHQLLLNYLGGMEDESVSSLISDCGWSLQQKEGGTMVVIGNQEATIRPKKILAKIEFDSVSEILSTAAVR